MKKILSLLSILSLAFLVVACETKTFTVTFESDGIVVSTEDVKEGNKVAEPNDPTKNEYDFEYWTLDDVEFNFNTKVTKDLTLVAKWSEIEVANIVFSKIFTAKRRANNVIELYNNSDDSVDLSEYRIDIYGDGSNEVTTTIELNGTIPANGYYVLGGEGFDDDEFEGVSNNFDYVYEGSLPFNGDDAMELVKKTKVVDFVGFNTGIAIRYSFDSTLIRIGNPENYQGSKTYDEYNFIKYLPEVFKYLKNDDHEIKTVEQLLEGPGLHEFYKDLPYAANNSGTGGAPIATLSHVADGDTATFFFAEKPAGSTSHRYYYIDTAETGGGNVNDEPWGHIGSKFNKEFLLNNHSTKEIRVQSVPKTGLTETYGRNLGLVWINGHLSQFLIVAEGLSKVDITYDDVDLELYWKDIPYRTFLLFAQKRAKDNGWGMHGYPSNPMGEMAPDWDYQNDRKAPTENYADWTPHNTLPW